MDNGSRQIGEVGTAPSVFVWKDLRFVEGPHADDSPISLWCPYCGSKYEHYSIEPDLERFPLAHVDDDDSWEEHRASKCRMCGFWYAKHRQIDRPLMWSSTSLDVAILKKFCINDSKLGLAELGVYLRKHFTDIHALSPRRFEELVANVFGNMGYEVLLTQQTRDGGYDILILERTSGSQLIVECKRYSKHRKVPVGIVREVLGVQVITGIRRAKIVTTSLFTKPAKEAAFKARSSAYELDLVDADRFAQALGVYNRNASLLSELNISGTYTPLDLKRLKKTVFVKGCGGRGHGF